MNNSVIIKGNNDGIRIIVPPEYELENLINELKSKLSDNKKGSTSGHPINITFEGKKLTEDEENKIINELNEKNNNFSKSELSENSNNHLIKLLNNNASKSNDNSSFDGLFYVGDLGYGQILETKASVIILGNVLYGAKVISTGNIIITGKLFGKAICGYGGNREAFVYELLQGGHIS